ncbi:hypothetical protein [Fuchsiella alkaliacetigena]|uniref:hypothetical protein n=1 Tax=Fuchsiella alkaliacetigena TaxID=957042 RepID=UPI00200B3CA0|nr:hypothetical protein [Fuchsiella alkaliacetigena]MCK8825539.1 hypothetical protein [Fuchsiella alkaliacetigena]
MKVKRKILRILVLTLLISLVGSVVTLASEREYIYNYSGYIQLDDEDLKISDIIVGSDEIEAVKEIYRDWLIESYGEENLERAIREYDSISRKDYKRNYLRHVFSNQDYEQRFYGDYLNYVLVDYDTDEIISFSISFFNRDEEPDMPKFKTNRGITRNSTVQEIFDAYGTRGVVYITHVDYNPQNSVVVKYKGRTDSGEEVKFRFIAWYLKGDDFTEATVNNIKLKLL